MAITYSIAAIPTQYNGRLYRSRLEAKWAAFFDLSGWTFEYEPFDLGKWSPDFLISGSDREILVEVKPVTDIDVPTIYKMHKAASEVGFPGELLLVGSSPFKGDFEQPYLGWLCSGETPCGVPGGRERRGYPLEMQMMPWFTRAEAIVVEGSADLIMPFPFDSTRGGAGYCTGLLSGIFVSEDYTWCGPRHPYRGIWRTWAEAANVVQWVPGQSSQHG